MENREWMDGLVDGVGELAASLGLNRSIGQLYAFLYMSPGPQSLDDMAQACAMSKGNVSLNIRELERWRAVRRVGVRGDRKDYYEANRDLPGIVIGRLQDGLGRRLQAMDGVLDQVEERLARAAGPSGKARFYQDRIQELRRYRSSLGKALKNLDRIYAVAKRFM